MCTGQKYHANDGKNKQIDNQKRDNRNAFLDYFHVLGNYDSNIATIETPMSNSKVISKTLRMLTCK